MIYFRETGLKKIIEFIIVVVVYCQSTALHSSPEGGGNAD